MTNEEINRVLSRPILSGNTYAAYMPPSDCSSRSLGRGDTRAAIEQMAATAIKYQRHTKKLSQTFFSNKTLSDLCQSLHSFLFTHFQYSIDGEAQLLRSPACSWASRFSGIDCKSYSIFASSVLLNLGVKHYMRRVIQPSEPNGYTHVYVIVPKNQKTANINQGYWVIDGTIPTMAEVPYLEADDVPVHHYEAATVKGTARTGKLGFSEATLDKMLEDSFLMSQSVNKLTKEQIVAKRLQITQIVGQTASATATVVGAVFPPALVVAAALEGVTAIVSLAFLKLSNPCNSAFYKPEYIHERLKNDFYSTFKQRFLNVRKHLEQGSYPTALPELNYILKEIDLGVVQFKEEIARLSGNDCEYNTLLGFNDFVEGIKKIVDTMVEMLLKLMQNDGYKAKLIDMKGSTSQRTMYFIVPVSEKIHSASFRRISLEHGDEVKGIYPLNNPESYSDWLNKQVIHLQVTYGDAIASSYRAQMQPIGDKIAAIRKDFTISTLQQLLREEELQKQQRNIYLQFDSEERQEVERKTLEAKKEFIKQNEEWLRRIRHIAELNKADEDTRIENINKIATERANRQAGIEKKKTEQLLLLALFGLASLILLKDE